MQLSKGSDRQEHNSLIHGVFLDAYNVLVKLSQQQTAARAVKPGATSDV